MAESLTPREPNRVLQAIADALARAKGALNWAPDVRTSAALAAGAPAPSSLVGDLVLGQAPEEVERWAHGSSPFKSSFSGISGRLPEVQDRRKATLVGAPLATALGAVAYGKAGMAAARQTPPAFGAFAVKPKGGMWSPKVTQEWRLRQ